MVGVTTEGRQQDFAVALSASLGHNTLTGGAFTCGELSRKLK
jgi:hypothetical protein